jgi:hypothetical protein
MAGNAAEARKAYEKFLDLWKDADPGIRIISARKASPSDRALYYSSDEQATRGTAAARGPFPIRGSIFPMRLKQCRERLTLRWGAFTGQSSNW